MLHDGDPRSTSMVSWKQRMKAGCMWCYSTIYKLQLLGGKI